MRHVRDVHLQLVMPARQLSHMNRIVEIARRLAVNRHNRQVTEIAPASQIGLGHRLRRRFRFRHHFRRKNVRQMMLSDNDLNVDADVARPAENLNHAARRRKAALGIARDFHVHYRAIQFRQPQSSMVRHALPTFAAPTFSRNSGVNSSPGGIVTSC